VVKHLSLCLSVCLSVCLSIFSHISKTTRLKFCLSVCLSFWPPVCVGLCNGRVSVCLPLRTSPLCLASCLSVYPSVCLSVCVGRCNGLLSVCLSAHLSVCLSGRLYVIIPKKTTRTAATRRRHDGDTTAPAVKHLFSGVFTCTEALSTPRRTRPSLESIYRVSLKVDLCEGNKIISFNKFISPQPVGGPSKREKNPGPWARAQCIHCLRRPCIYPSVYLSAWVCVTAVCLSVCPFVCLSACQCVYSSFERHISTRFAHLDNERRQSD